MNPSMKKELARALAGAAAAHGNTGAEDFSMDPNATPSKPQPSRKTRQRWTVVERLTVITGPTHTNHTRRLARVVISKAFRRALKLTPKDKNRDVYTTLQRARRAITKRPDPTTALLASLDLCVRVK